MRVLRVLLLGLVGACGLALSGCQASPPPAGSSGQSDKPLAASGSSSDRIQQILERGQLRVGMSGNQPPLNMMEKSGRLVGLDVDLATALAHSMGVEVDLIVKPFGDLLPSLQKGELDAVVSGVTITPERNAHVAFAGPYFITGKSLLTKSDTLAEIEDASRLNDSSRSFAALSGSTSERFVTDQLPDAKLVTTQDFDSAVELLKDDKVDAVVGDHQVVMLTMWRNRTLGLRATTTPFTVEPLGIALPADSPLFVNLVDNYLDTLEYTGLLMQMKARWLSEGDWVGEVP